MIIIKYADDNIINKYHKCVTNINRDARMKMHTRLGPQVS